MEGKIITCCGDCVHYDWKKHKCRNGYNDETDPRKHFYSDCKTLEDLEEHDAKVRADAINEYVTRFEAENITDANAERLKPFIFEMHRLAEQMQKREKE